MTNGVQVVKCQPKSKLLRRQKSASEFDGRVAGELGGEDDSEIPVSLIWDSVFCVLTLQTQTSELPSRKCFETPQKAKTRHGKASRLQLHLCHLRTKKVSAPAWLATNHLSPVSPVLHSDSAYLEFPSIIGALEETIQMEKRTRSMRDVTPLLVTQSWFSNNNFSAPHLKAFLTGSTVFTLS